MRPEPGRWAAVVVLLAAGGWQMAAVAAEGDPEAGRKKADAVCSACHGATGISNADLWPNLAAQKHGYLVKQMKAYRDGERKDPIMSTYAQSLTDQEIADLAAFYSQLPPAGVQQEPGWYDLRKDEKAP